MTKHDHKLEMRSALPLETRDDHEDDPLAQATAAVEELRTGFESFRTEAEKARATETRAMTEG